MKKHSFSKHRGFTLIELMIVVVIVAILGGIALPSYQDHVVSSRRADAQGALMGLSQAMERYYTERGTYVGAADGSNVPTVYPSTSPSDGSTVQYNLRVTTLTATNYVLTATPTGGQAGRDGNLTLDSLGAKTWTNADGGVRNCWTKSCAVTTP